MGTAGVLILLILSAAIAAGVVAYIIINHRKRQEAQLAAERLQRENEEARGKAKEEHQRRKAEEARRKVEEERQRREAEEAERKAEEERQRREVEEARRKAEEERQRREAEEAERKAEEERQYREAEDTQRKAEEERLRREGEEALRKAEEERQRRGAKEAQRKAEEESQRRGAKEAQRKTEEESQRHKEEEGKRKAEEERQQDGRGRPRISTSENKEPVTRESKPHQPKPEIVCWQRERRWILAVEVPEDLWEKPKLVVHQNASPLAEDEREGYWCLDQIRGQVTVCWNEDEAPQEAKIKLGEENYFLFKLGGQDQKQGRRVKSCSSGSYFVVVPESWERDEKFSGSPPASPELVSVEGCQGHFFDLEKGGDKRIAFRTSEGKSILIESKAARFELVGNRLSDVSEGIGPLFGKSPPRIRALHDWLWTDIGTIVVGEEGSKKGRWRKPFNPVPERREQDLPPEVAARKDGWYFLRFYDMDVDLVESLDFRLVCALREIKIFQPSPFPSEAGHESVHVEFHHEPGFVIQPADDHARSIKVESKDNKTILIVPSKPIYDETRWRVGSEGKTRVQITILVERLWWTVGQEGALPIEWEDKLLFLTCDDFTATSKKVLWLRLPTRRWVDRILVGFEQSRARPYVVKIAETEISIPLRDFGDCQEMRDRDRDQFLNLWIELDDTPIGGNVAIIPASKGPILYVGHGKKERAMAIAVLRMGPGVITVNGQSIEDYFEKAPVRAKHFLQRLLEMSYVSKELGQLDVSIEVTGSNPRTVQQVKASTHALARALMRYKPDIRPQLRKEGFGRYAMREAFR